VICTRCNRETIVNSDYAPSLTIPSVCWSCLDSVEQQTESAVIERFTCAVCGGFREGNTCCGPECPEDTYHLTVCFTRPSVALSMLALWERPWSTQALRFAAHILQRAWNHGCDVLEGAL
jgi:hypothetical protein